MLGVFVTKRRDRKAVFKFLKTAMKHYGRTRLIVADRLRSYSAAIIANGILNRQACERWLNNWAENSHQSFRQREGL